MNKIAIMQPYLFPYIGYFQLIKEVDRFIFYDDVHFITRGWINRNKILINGQPKYFTVSCKNASQNVLINTVKHNLDDKTRSKLLKKIKFTYSKAPYFDNVFSLFERTLHTDSEYISDLATSSVTEVCDYLGLTCSFDNSSELKSHRDLSAADRLIDISNQEQATFYVNPIGGKDLYSKEYFSKRGIQLEFLEPDYIDYQQFDKDFVPWLSIIDVLMFNSPSQVISLLDKYTLK